MGKWGWVVATALIFDSSNFRGDSSCLDSADDGLAPEDGGAGAEGLAIFPDFIAARISGGIEELSFLRPLTWMEGSAGNTVRG